MNGRLDGWVYLGQQSGSRGIQGHQWGAKGAKEVKQMDIWGEVRTLRYGGSGLLLDEKKSQNLFPNILADT